MGLFDGKVAVVTGAGNGIGREAAVALAHAGARVLVNDVGCGRDGRGRDPAVADAVAHDIQQAGGVAVASHEDVSTPHGARATVELALSSFGRVDALLNCAGVVRDSVLLNVTDEDVDAVLGAPLRAALYCVRAVAPHMREAGGRIVNTTALAGLLGNHGQTAYSIANAGVYALTRAASIELQRFGITVNAVAPLAKTRMTADVPMFEKATSLTAEHVVPAYLFLASDLCGERTGHVLSVAGAKLSVIRLAETPGRFKEAGGGTWTPEEIAEHWHLLAKP